jgi:hypothetical protein
MSEATTMNTELIDPLVCEQYGVADEELALVEGKRVMTLGYGFAGLGTRYTAA